LIEFLCLEGGGQTTEAVHKKGVNQRSAFAESTLVHRSSVRPIFVPTLGPLVCYEICLPKTSVDVIKVKVKCIGA
jgi:hypothetical protein